MSTVKSMLLVGMSFILIAVDFPSIFPRYFCKTEEFGVSLMDVGAAGVIMTSGYS